MENEDIARTYRRLANESTVRLILGMAAHWLEMKKPRAIANCQDYRKSKWDMPYHQ